MFKLDPRQQEQHRPEKRSMRELAALRTVSASAGVGGEW